MVIQRVDVKMANIINIVIDPWMISEIDKLAGSQKRSSFIRKAVQERIDRLKEENKE